uniref:ARID domain-containing protein n=1 Tax=Schistosoma mansoni TaxID=6183 RepID=A0A5K4FB54_SCHMA
MCDLLSQPQQQQQQRQQRTGQKLSTRQLNKNQHHLSIIDTNSNSSSSNNTTISNNTGTSAEMSSNLCTNSNRFNNSINNGSRSSKLNQQQQQQNTQRPDINSLVDDDNTTDSIGSNNSSIKHTSWSPSESSNNTNNNNSNSRGNSSLKDQNHISINGDLQQQQQQGICSSKNETLNPLSDMNSQCSIIEQRSKTSISFDSIQLTHSNHSNSNKNDHCSLTSSKSPPLSPSNSSSSSSSSNHSLSFRNNENSQWNNNHNIGKDVNTIDSFNAKSQIDMTAKSNSPIEDNSYHVKLSRYDHQQNRRQSNKSNISSYCISSDQEMNYDKECQKRQPLGKDLDVKEKKHDEDEEEEREGVEYKNDCIDGGNANGDVDDVDGVNNVDRNITNADNNDDDADDDDDDNDGDNDNSYLIDQQTNHHYSTSFPTLTSDSLSNCISPMLAAAAMAALTTGCFPTSCNQLSQLNYSLLSKSYGISQLSPPPTPLHPPPPPPLTLQPPVLPSSSSSSSAYTQRLHMTKQQQQLAFLNSTPNRNSKVNDTHHSHSHHHHQHNNGNSLSSLGCNSSPPIHSIHSNNDNYNTITNNKSNYASTSPPPQLSSRSNSPHQLLNNRLVSSNNLNYLSSMDDVDEENDEMDSDEVDEEIEGEEMDNSSTHGNNHQWTFEEQFKQLYVISDDPKRKEFLDELFVYMQRRGTPVNRIPIMAKQVLDLYELFQLVVARGGLVEVINKKLWREITKGLNLPSSITSAAFTLRTQYMKYLYPYECETLGLSSPNELQAAIDGNRREARRSSYTFDYPMMNPPNTSRSTSPVSTTSANPQTTTTTNTSTTMTASNTIPNSPSPLNVNPSLSNSIVYPNSLGFPNGTNPDVNQLLSNIPTGSTPFCTNNLGFNTQFGQFNPFLTMPTGSLPANGLGLQPSSTISSSSTASVSATVPSNQIGNSPVNLFPSHLLPSMVSAPNFSIIGSHFQGFNTSLNNSDDPFITSSSPSSSIQSGTILPGIPNNFTDPNAMAAAAAAAATLFGAGFPTLPGAFTATPPSLPLSLQTTISMNTPPLTTTTTTTLNNSYLVNNSSLINQSDGCLKFPILNNLRNQANHSNPNNLLIDTNESNTSSGLRSKNKLTLHDNDDCQFTSSLPLNLTANETGLINLDEKGTPYTDSDSRSSLMPLDHEKLNNKLQYYNNEENELITLHSDDRFIQKDGKDNLLNNFNETDRKVNNLRRHHHKDTIAADDDDDDDDDDNHINDGDDDNCSGIQHENIELRCKSNPSVEVNKRELIGTNNTISNNNNRIQQTNFKFENEDSNIKTAAQVACQQLWAAAAAAAAGLHCGGIKTPETNNYGVLTGNLNGPLKSQQVESSNNITTTTNNSNNNKQTQQLSCSKSSSYSSNKKTNSRTPSHLDTPNAKIPKLSSSNQMNSSSSGNNSNEIGGKQSNNGSNLSMKSSDLRKQNEAITMSANLHFNNNSTSTGLNNSLSAAQLSMATQNFRIQTQPGAPMGLPQNAIVVTMEMGNILYQGVLFGQLKR